MALTAMAFLGAALWLRLGPLPPALLAPAASWDFALLDRHGETLTPALTANAADGPELALRADKLAAATLAAEDRRFYLHPGVDPLAIARAAWADLRRRRLAQGGSTLTQQLVKIRSGRPARGFVVKWFEMVWALRLEHRLGKSEILSAYLAEAPYGGRIIGAPAAARYYFDKPVSQLSWAEAAFLAALPQRPTAFNPRRDPLAARERQAWVLRALHQQDTISAAELQTALAAQDGDFLRPGLKLQRDPAPHFAELVTAALRAAGAEGGRVITTLDLPLQRDVAGIARHQRALLVPYGAANVAVVVLDNATGGVRAWEGSGDYFDLAHGGMLNGPLIPRQTGSTIKPFLYALAFADGAAPGDRIDDRPLTVSWNGQTFSPENYDHKYRGPVSLRVALGSSINVAAVQLLKKLGADRLGKFLHAAQLTTPQPAARYGLSLALGAAELPLLGMTRAYAGFARGGMSLPVRVLEPTADAQREAAAWSLEADAAIPAARRIMPPEAAFLVSDVLADNRARAPAFGEESALRLPFPAAAKTGTSQDFRDNWTIGYTREFTVGVWVGNFDRQPMHGATGVTGAGPVFQAVMLAARVRLTPDAGDRPLLPVPDTLAWLPLSQPAPATAAAAPAEWDYQWRSAVNSAGPPAAMAAGPPPASMPRPTAPPLMTITPAPGAHYFHDPLAPAAYAQLALNATGGAPPYRWRLDGRALVPRRAPGDDAPDWFWPLRAGRHEACVKDGAGTERCAKFRVD